MTTVMEPIEAKEIKLGGILGTALDASRRGRLKVFAVDETSQPIQIFNPAVAEKNFAGDWNGEHAGKWLYTAARAAYRTQDESLARTVRRVADFLAARQEPNGYLGTYASTAPSRFTSPMVAGVRTWDIWVHSYVILGLLETNRYFPEARYLAAARRMGDLCWKTIVQEKADITGMGNHFGLSATILIEPAVELYRVTGARRYLELARTIVMQAEAKPELRLVSRALSGDDPQKMDDGKIYQLLWTFDGLLRLGIAEGVSDYRRAVEQVWNAVAQHHLTPSGGPWGGAGADHENFNPPSYFSPYGMVETCSVMSWIHLNRDLLRLTGEARYAEELERTAYNELLAAHHPNGNDWSYFSFPNGSWTATYDWACCKSSGALALEELPPLVFGQREGGISLNLYAPAAATVETSAGPVRVNMDTRYPREGAVTLTFALKEPARFPLFVRIPSWAGGTEVAVSGGQQVGAIQPGTFVRVEGIWRPGDRVIVQLPMKLRIERRSAVTPHEEGEIARLDYAALLRGPLVYSTGLIDGYKKQDSFRLPKESPGQMFRTCAPPPGAVGPAFCLRTEPGRPIPFVPYYEAGGRSAGNWHLTWFGVAWE